MTVVVAVFLFAALVGVPSSCGQKGTVSTQTSAPPSAAATDSGQFSSTDSASPSGSDTSGASSDATVTVEKAGFAYKDHYGTAEASYGVVLRNSSASDAEGVTVEVDLESKSGLIVDSESESINVIPANSVYYLGGDTFPDSKVRKVEASVTVGSSESAQNSLPKISHVTVGEDFGDTFVRGIVTNPYTQALSDTAQISIVLFGPTGKVVGGGFTYLDNPLKPGRSAMFSSTNGIDVTPRSSIAKVGVSMDNESE